MSNGKLMSNRKVRMIYETLAATERTMADLSSAVRGSVAASRNVVSVLVAAGHVETARGPGGGWPLVYRLTPDGRARAAILASQTAEPTDWQPNGKDTSGVWEWSPSTGKQRNRQTGQIVDP